MPSEHDLTLRAFGRALSAARRERGWTQADFAEAMGLTSPETISRYERGEREPRLSTLLRMAAVLHRPVADLVGAPASAPGIVGSESGTYANQARRPARANASYLAPAPDDDARALRNEIVAQVDRLAVDRPDVLAGLVLGLRGIPS